MLKRIIIARQVNNALGGAFVSPFDVGDLTGDFLDAVRALYSDLEAVRKNLKKLEDTVKKWRQSHPTYRKRKQG